MVLRWRVGTIGNLAVIIKDENGNRDVHVRIDDVHFGLELNLEGA